MQTNKQRQALNRDFFLLLYNKLQRNPQPPPHSLHFGPFD